MKKTGGRHALMKAFTLAGMMVVSTTSPAFAENVDADMDADATLRYGERLEDGTILAGDNVAATATDAPGLYTWAHGHKYCEDLDANGHDDWRLPETAELNGLYQNKNAGAFAGTFNENSSASHAGWYWSSEEDPRYTDGAWQQNFGGGYQGWFIKDYDVSLRCVRSMQP